MPTQKGAIISDIHSGHETGLTHPKHNPKPDPDHNKYVLWQLRKIQWEWFVEKLKPLGKLDLLLVNGDAIDGKGEKSGGTELIEADRNAQAVMAKDVISHVRAKEIRMTYGTSYHTGIKEDFEDVVADLVGCPRPQAVLDVEMNGRVINARHHIGASSIPHGRATQLLKEALWNKLWAERGEFPKADVIFRSHVHYYQYAGDADRVAMITPGLQGYGSKFGSRRVSGTIDFGFVSFEIDTHGRFTWEPHILRYDKVEAEKI